VCAAILEEQCRASIWWSNRFLQKIDMIDIVMTKITGKLKLQITDITEYGKRACPVAESSVVVENRFPAILFNFFNSKIGIEQICGKRKNILLSQHPYQLINFSEQNALMPV